MPSDGRVPSVLIVIQCKLSQFFEGKSIPGQPNCHFVPCATTSVSPHFAALYATWRLLLPPVSTVDSTLVTVPGDGVFCRDVFRHVRGSSAGPSETPPRATHHLIRNSGYQLEKRRIR